jgi:hypothetical protein
VAGILRNTTVGLKKRSWNRRGDLSLPREDARVPMTSANVEIFQVAKPQSPGAVLMYPARRIARRLLRPWLVAIAQRFDDLDSSIASVSAELGALANQTDQPISAARLPEVVERMDGIADHVTRMSEGLAYVASDLHRLDDDLATVQALGWDHIAVVNRLGQLEDRLNGDHPS